MAKKLSASQVLALKGWSLKITKRGLFIKHTNTLDPESWRGPYGNIQRACTAITRLMQAEVAKRVQQ